MLEQNVQFYEDGMYSDEGRIHAAYKKQIDELRAENEKLQRDSKYKISALEKEIKQLREELAEAREFMGKGGRKERVIQN
jgi:predicted RNase H-like nuclease (RuvC/YqgF family)